MPTVPVITRREGLDTDRGGAPRARVDAGAMMVADAVQGVSDAAMGIATRLHNRQQEKELQGEAVKLQQFKLDSEQLLESEASNISADGSEFFRNVDKKYAQLVENYRNSLSPEAAERFGPRYDLVTDDVLNRAAQAEAEQGRAYARDQIGKAHEAKLIALQRSPELVEQIQKNGMIDIDELGATLPEAEREALKEAWSSNATYASELAKVQSDPEYAQRYSAPREQYYAAVRSTESGGNDNAKNPNSSATGRYQFTEGTWEDLRTRFPGAGLTSDGRTDPQQQETAIRLFTAQNERLLANSGITPTNGNLYAAHFLGAGDAVKVLNADQDAKLDDLLSDEVLNANPHLKGKSVWQFRSWAERKAGGGDIPEGMTLKQYNDLRTKAVASNTAAKTQRKEAYDLAIVTGDLTNPEVFLQDSLLDDGDKATLYRAFETANKDRALVGAIMAGGRINSFDADQRRAGDKAYSQLIEGSTPEQTAAVGQAFVEQTGYIPSALRSELRNGAASDNPQELANAMTAANYYSNAAPKHFNSFEGGESIRKDMERYNASVDIGYSTEQAAQKIIDSRDPEKRRSREALLESTEVKDTLDDINESSVIDMYDQWGLFNRPDGFATEEAKLIAVQDYKTLLQDAIVEADGDMDVAKQVASERFQKVYNVSTMTLASRDGQIIQKHVPEVAYPEVNGSHDYVRNQAYQTLVEQEIDGILAGRVGAFSVEDVYLQPFDQTEADIEAGRNARYLLYFEDNGRMQMYNLPFFAIPEQPTYDFSGNRRKRDVNRMQEDYRQSVISGENPGSFIESTKKTQPIRPAPTEETTRGREEEAARRALEERAFREGQKAYDETVGPDWMKAKSQADTIERILQGLD